MKQFLIIFTVLLAISNLQAQEKKESLLDIMQYEEVLEMQLQLDLALLQENRRQDEYHDAFINFTDRHGVPHHLATEVKIRGKFRRIKCDTPPLKLKWKKDDLEALGLVRDFNDMKMVTYCSADKEEAKEWIYKEYLAYQMYEQFSEFSFRTQLIKVTFVDPVSNTQDEQWGILIEDTAELAARIGAERCEDCLMQPATAFATENVKDVALFEYLIGNADFDFRTSKNLKIFRIAGKLIAIPYDFDSAGLVNTAYAIPNPNYGLLSVKERVYIGFSEHLSEMETTQKRFSKQRRSWDKLIANFDLLSKDSRQEMRAYFMEFFTDHDQLNVIEEEVIIVD